MSEVMEGVRSWGMVLFKKDVLIILVNVSLSLDPDSFFSADLDPRC